MAEQDDLDTVALLMADLRKGQPEAAGKLVNLFYPELRRLAKAKMGREKREHTWQPTELVHELYLELLRIRSLPGGEERREKAAFLSLASRMMERRLIDHARPLAKRLPKLELTEAELVDPHFGEEKLAYIAGLLDGLAAIDPKFRTVVELRVFLGMNLEEIAEQMGCSSRSAATYWSFARNWLEKKMGEPT